MSQSLVIARNRQDPDGLDFAALRKEAVALAQKLSGKIWTDYNLHDPGVTILEQICFGLTELAYQSDIAVEEYLSDEYGVIDFQKFSLFKPHEILSNSAVTLRDYCKLFIDAMPEVDGVHLLPVGKGVYNIHLRLQRALTGVAPGEARERQLISMARQVYLRNRNLGEDLKEIVIDPSEPCFLKLNIEIGGRRPSAEIAADILFQCARCISSNIRIQRYEDAYRDNPDLAQLFDGPLTHRGHIDNEHLNQVNYKPSQELNNLVAAISGVKQIYELKLVDAGGKAIPEEQAERRAFHLQLPETSEQLGWLVISTGAGNSREKIAQVSEAVHLEKNKKLLADTRRYLQRLEFEYNAFRTNQSQAASFYGLPSGRTRTSQQYFSIQQQFPDIYGINAAGVPSTETSERKNQARQLKAYLYPIEQLMGNFLQQIQELHSLFEIGEVRRQSYFSRYLDDRHIPHIEPLYTVNVALKVPSVEARYDNFCDRKNRALNSLLAIYGEVFPEDQLAHFDDYHQGTYEYWMIDNKIHFLAHLVSLSSARARGFDQAESHWQTDNISIAQKKISILLGLSQVSRHKSLSQVATELRIKLVADEPLLQKPSTREASNVTAELLPELDDRQVRGLHKWQYQPAATITLSESMVRGGVYLSNYRLVESDGQVDVYFKLPHQPQMLFLKSLRKRSDAVAFAHKFKKIITQFNLESEGFHLIEHLLLRPRSPVGEASQIEEHDCGPDPFVDNFFDHQLSVIFPAWTARAGNPAFRQYVQQQLNENLPAHLLPQTYWLDFSAMVAFEQLYQQWLEALHSYQQACVSQEAAGVTALNEHAAKLASWLRDHRQPQEYWV